MVDVFLNSANFAPHAFLTLVPPSGYVLNLKALIKVSKVSWTSQLSYEILRSSLERKFDKTNFISQKSTPPKSPGLLGLKPMYTHTLCNANFEINPPLTHINPLLTVSLIRQPYWTALMDTLIGQPHFIEGT